jgi:hypothetical protein
VRYPVSELAARYGASVPEVTSDWRQAYATGRAVPARTAAELGSSAVARRFLQALSPNNKALMVEQTRDDAPGVDADDEQRERDRDVSLLLICDLDSR